MGHKISEQEILEILKSKNIELLEPYKGSSNKIHKVKCRCGIIYERQLKLVTRKTTKGCGRSCKFRILPQTKLKESVVKKKLRKNKIQLLEPYKGSQQRHKLKCHCGKIFYSSISHFLNNESHSCGCSRKNQRAFQWHGCGELSGTYYGGSQTGAKLRGLEFNVSIEELWDLFLKQDKKCALSGVELTFHSRNRKILGTASLDRIDNFKGYVKGNVQWVHKRLNWMKNRFNNDEFIYWNQKIAINNPHYVPKREYSLELTMKSKN